jgi:hypothetical protein
VSITHLLRIHTDGSKLTPLPGFAVLVAQTAHCMEYIPLSLSQASLVLFDPPGQASADVGPPNPLRKTMPTEAGAGIQTSGTSSSVVDLTTNTTSCSRIFFAKQNSLVCGARAQAVSLWASRGDVVDLFRQAEGCKSTMAV